MSDFTEGDSVFITGTIEGSDIRVVRLRAEVATVYPKGHMDHSYFKVWPHAEKDPQLTPALQEYGKLWFDRRTAYVEVIHEGV